MNSNPFPQPWGGREREREGERDGEGEGEGEGEGKREYVIKIYMLYIHVHVIQHSTCSLHARATMCHEKNNCRDILSCQQRYPLAPQKW